MITLRRAIIIIVLILSLLVIVCLVSAAAWLNPCQYFTRSANQIPATLPGFYNVAVVLSGNSQDGGWSQSHAQGFEAIRSLPGINAVLFEDVPEFCPTQRFFEALSEQGYRLIFGAAFGYQESIQAAAQTHPDSVFIHILGLKRNDRNLDNLNGAMEEMMYLAGMVGGLRAAQDGNPRLGYIASFPIPEQFRWANATALGMRRTCPTCTMELEWLNAWRDRAREKRLATQLYERGARVVVSVTDSSDAVLEAAAEKTAWAVAMGQRVLCTTQECLTAPYWNWGPIYLAMTSQVQGGSFQPRSVYFHAESGGMGIVGLMPGDVPTKGMADLPPEGYNLVRQTLLELLQGKQEAQLAIFKGPIKSNRGENVVPEGVFLEFRDTDQFPPGDPENRCKYCICWWVDGIVAELPEVCRNTN
jgi:basic membrane protein A